MTDHTAERRTALVAAGLAVPLALLAVLVDASWGPLVRLDARIATSVHQHAPGTWVAHLSSDLSTIGQPRVAEAIAAVIALALLLRRRWVQAAWVVASAVLTWLATHGSKAWIARPRPDVPHQISGWSFPSGHASQIACTAAVVLILGAGVSLRWLRTSLIIASVAAAALVGLSRLGVDAHYPSDVVAGWLLGALIPVALWIGVLAVRDPRTAIGRLRPHRRHPDRPLATVPVTMRTLGVVVNPIRIDSDAFRIRVSSAARAAGWDEPLWFETTADDTGASMARAAVAAGAQVVVAAGGDGTVRVVCAEMAGRGIPVGIVPAGTGNLLARNLGIPLARDQALDVALRGQDRAIDLVGIEGDGIVGTRFAVMAGMGLDAAIMDGAPDRLKRRMGWPAYFVSGMRQLRYPAVRVEIAVDDEEPVQRRARTVVIGNVGSLTAGIPLLPDARIDDGVLDVVVIAPRRLLGWVPLLWRVLRRHPRTDEWLDRFTGRRVVVTAASPTPRQLDGDTVGAGTQLRATVEPGVLLVRVPR